MIHPQRIFHFTILLFLFVSCSSNKSDKYFGGKKIHFVEFCDLPKYKNEIVITEFYYTGFVEYWWIYNKQKQCELGNQTNLTFQDYNSIPKKFKNIIDKQSNYEILKITAIGKYDDSNLNGYGHSGNNQSEFTTIEIVKLEKKGKWTPKN